VDPGLRGPEGRHHLAVTLHPQGRRDEAQWRQVVGERPGFLSAWLGLAEIAFARGDLARVKESATRLESLTEPGPLEAGLVRGRVLLARKEFDAARDLAGRLGAAYPKEVGPRLSLSHAYLREGADPSAAADARVGPVVGEGAALDVLAGCRGLRPRLRPGRPRDPALVRGPRGVRSCRQR
jgi:hypothetical protein